MPEYKGVPVKAMAAYGEKGGGTFTPFPNKVPVSG